MEKKEKSIDKEKKVVLATEDINNIRNFWEHFKIPANEKLTNALAAFEAAPTYDNQQNVKVAICNVIAASEHPAFKDSMITGIHTESTHVSYQSQFDKDLTEVLTEPVAPKPETEE